MNWITGIGTAVGLLGLGILYGTLKAAKTSVDAAKRSAEISAKQLELAERPWVDANASLNGPYTFNVNGANIALKIELRNSGHTPAVGTQIRPLPVIGLRGDPSQYLDTVCAAARQSVLQNPYFGIALFPNVTAPYFESVGIGKEDIEKKSKDSPGVIMLPSVVICIAYRPTFDDTFVYDTSYIFDLYKLDSNNSPGATFKIGEDVDVKHLLFTVA